MASEEANKEVILKLLDLGFVQKNVPAAAEYLTDGYIQHSPQVPTGKAGLIRGLTRLHETFPDLAVEVKHIWADGDYVILHSLFRFTKDGPGTAIVDMFRIVDGKADEHWDVRQQIPDMMAHENGMF